MSTVQSLANLLPLRYMTGSTGAQTQPPVTEADPTKDQEEEDTTPQYKVPKPRTAFSAFVDHPKEFIGFLETLAEQPDLKQEAKVDLFTTLFEMYLDTAKTKKDAAEKQEWEDKAKKLIEGKDVSLLTSSRSLLHLFAAKTNETRFLYLHPMFSFSPTFPTSVKGLHLYGNRRAFALTSSAPLPQQRIHKVPFRH